jgi:2-polyprenyl-3-methyl-5-hydroxy-6-metoxy-1,4-benzoquinol methylase
MERKLYGNNHWARLSDHEQALKKYLEQYKNPFDCTKVKIFESLLHGSLKGKIVLDYGGGAGFMFILCAKKEARVILVDAEENALLTAKLYAKISGVLDQIEFIRSEVFPQELKKRRFDIILSKDIVEHIDNDKEFLRNLAFAKTKVGN